MLGSKRPKTRYGTEVNSYPGDDCIERVPNDSSDVYDRYQPKDEPQQNCKELGKGVIGLRIGR